MPKIMVTGINGFVGKHLVKELEAQNCEIVGVGRDKSIDKSLKNFVADYYVCDLTKKHAVDALPLDSIDVVISLAGLAKLGESFDRPDLYNRVNVNVLAVLAERILMLGHDARVIAVSSGTVYDSNQSMPLTEKSKLTTNGSPYTISKIDMEQAVLKLRERGLDCIVVRPFNHIGPGQMEGFIVPDLYKKLVVTEPGGRLMVGNLKTRRDYTDVRDVVKAYTALALADSSKLSSDTYNVCSGITRSGEDILNELKKHVPGSENIEIEVDPSFVRPNDPGELMGSNKLINKDAGWEPKIPFEQTIVDFVKYQEANL